MKGYSNKLLAKARDIIEVAEGLLKELIAKAVAILQKEYGYRAGTIVSPQEWDRVSINPKFEAALVDMVEHFKRNLDPALSVFVTSGRPKKKGSSQFATAAQNFSNAIGNKSISATGRFKGKQCKIGLEDIEKALSAVKTRVEEDFN